MDAPPPVDTRHPALPHPGAPAQPFEAALPDGIVLRGWQAGAGQPRRVLCLHGFPEGPFVWAPLLRTVSPMAHVIAPAMRGYAPSTVPAEVSAYRPRHLVGDVAALVHALGAPVDVLVAHDWGGAVAWNFAATHPDLLKQLVIVNAPHPATFLRALQHDPGQQAASAYMRDLIHDDAEARLAADDHAALASLFGPRRASGAEPDGLRLHRAQWRAGLSGPLNYYRASPLRPPDGPDDPVHALQVPPSLARVEVPTTVLWGEADAALRPVLLDGLERWVPTLRVVRLPGVGHWVLQEAPEAVVQAVREALTA